MFFFKIYINHQAIIRLYNTPTVANRKALSLQKNFGHFLIVSYSLSLLIRIILLRTV